MELSPDGRYVATVTMELAEGDKNAGLDSYGKTSAVLLIPIDGGEPRELLRVSRPARLVAHSGMSWAPDSQAVIVMKTLDESRKEKELWLVPIGDGKARKLDIDVAGWDRGGGHGIRLHPNGRQIAFFAGKQSEEVWALENFLSAPNASE